MIELTGNVKAQLMRRALAAAPLEACGLVSKGERCITLWEAQNAAEDPSHAFLIDPRCQLRIINGILETGETLVGVYHSHPNQGAAPSPSDEELARLWPGLTWLIVGLNGVVEPGDADEADFFAGVLCPE